jgi:hypothetical protein
MAPPFWEALEEGFEALGVDLPGGWQLIEDWPEGLA